MKFFMILLYNIHIILKILEVTVTVRKVFCTPMHGTIITLVLIISAIYSDNLRFSFHFQPMYPAERITGGPIVSIQTYGQTAHHFHHS